jgi:hypothetical protein
LAANAFDVVDGGDHDADEEEDGDRRAEKPEHIVHAIAAVDHPTNESEIAAVKRQRHIENGSGWIRGSCRDRG